MKRLKIFALAMSTLLLGLFPAAVVAQEMGAESVMNEFSISLAGDPDGALSLLSDNVIIQIVPPPPGETGMWAGSDEARAFLEFTQHQNASRELVGCWLVNGSVVSGTVMVTANHFVTWGVDPVEHLLEAKVEGGKITSWTSTMLVEERERVAAGREAFQSAQQSSRSAEQIEFYEQNHLLTRDSSATSQNSPGPGAQRDRGDTVEWHRYVSQRDSRMEPVPVADPAAQQGNGEQAEWQRGNGHKVSAEATTSDTAARCGGYTSTYRTDSALLHLFP